MKIETDALGRVVMTDGETRLVVEWFPPSVCISKFWKRDGGGKDIDAGSVMVPEHMVGALAAALERRKF